MLTDSPGDRGVCLSPCSCGVWSKTWVLGWESGERPQHTGAPAKPNHISSGHWPPFLGTYCPPEEYPKLFHYTLINPGLSALGKVTLFIKMPLWVSLKKKKNCSTMVICIPREKKKSGVHCPVTKKIRGTHMYTPPPNLVFSVFTLALC